MLGFDLGHHGVLRGERWEGDLQLVKVGRVDACLSNTAGKRNHGFIELACLNFCPYLVSCALVPSLDDRPVELLGLTILDIIVPQSLDARK